MIRYTSFWVVFAYFINALGAEAESLPDLERFDSDKIVPDVLDQVPREIATVKYGSIEANMGETVAPSDAQHPPTVSYSADPMKFYTLVMVDPDIPSRSEPLYRDWLNWLVVNIPGSNVTEGETVVAYRGPVPVKNSGLHRYIFIIYGQPDGKIAFDEPKVRADQRSSSERGNFSARKFAAKYNLGKPLAGNFFQAKWAGVITE